MKKKRSGGFMRYPSPWTIENTNKMIRARYLISFEGTWTRILLKEKKRPKNSKYGIFRFLELKPYLSSNHGFTTMIGIKLPHLLYAIVLSISTTRIRSQQSSSGVNWSVIFRYSCLFPCIPFVLQYHTETLTPT